MKAEAIGIAEEALARRPLSAHELLAVLERRGCASASAVVEALVARGIVDDLALARRIAERNPHRSTAWIEGRLAGRGLPSLALELDEDARARELLVRRRYRDCGAAARALERGGFAEDVIRRVVGAEFPDVDL